MKKILLFLLVLLTCSAIKSTHMNNMDLVETDMAFKNTSETKSPHYRLSDSEKKSFLIIKDSLMRESLENKNDTVK